MRGLVYIAAPYGPVGDIPDDPESEIRRNVARALALGQLAAVRGYAPIVPHAPGFLGVYGCPNEKDGGLSRTRAIETGEAHAAAVGRAGGEFWLLLPDGKSEPSPGCARELAAFKATRPPVFEVLACASWEGWRLAFVVEDLATLHDDPLGAFWVWGQIP